MDLSIVIVNYNVRHFLEQCLYSVEKAISGISAEVYVVDNSSVDGSCKMVEEKFPWVKLIANKDNVGFSKANNQAIRESEGKYILLLNPDTFVQEDTLKRCVDFAEATPDLGGLGVKMIDGKGKFLPESKRSLPTPDVAFFKIFGLSALFPKSPVFGKYHLGYLDNNKTHQVDVLAGAFMFLRRTVLDKTGLLDETFFMYGEDIDLSYRITKEGFKNYYFPETTIIHYKGESTKKSSINYVMVFYKAMIIFANKHFSANNAKIYSLLINTAVYLRAGLGIVRRIASGLFDPLLDFIGIYLGFYLLSDYWEKYQFGVRQYYPERFFLYVVPAYIAVWMFLLFIFGGYEKRIKPWLLVRSIFSGTLFILLIYALLPESLRFSRAMVLFGTIWALGVVFLVRILGTILFNNRKLIFGFGKKRIAIVGSSDESKRVISILSESKIIYEFTGRVITAGQKVELDVLGSIDKISDIVKINRIDELVFCSQDIAAGEIIETMLLINNPSIDFKIAPPESISVIGSNSINTSGDLYVVDINSLSKGLNKRKKRMFDMVASMILFFLSPVVIFTMKQPLGLLSNIGRVFIGKITWVGVVFEKHEHLQQEELKQGILNPADVLKTQNLTLDLRQRMNVMYAKDYKVLNDLVILVKCFRRLGAKPTL